MSKRSILGPIALAVLLLGLSPGFGQDVLRSLGRFQDFVSRRVSSYDRTGGNKDSLTIGPGETALLAEIRGPAAIHHLWVTIAAEAFYGRKLVLRLYWDGEAEASVETPIGDFFGVGHGLNRNLTSLPINCSSEGRAKNAYWYMPFAKLARLTVTNEGREAVPAFYYYVDYRELADLAPDTPYFHALYRQEFPCRPATNYLLFEAAGHGHYVGCNLSVLQQAMGWWGEGDDMIFVDGEDKPSLHGTGSEDYFSDAWGMRQDENPFYGCPLQEEDFQAGSKATVYRFHIPDPIPFRKSIRVTIEHGHANDRSDYFSSVAYWYQAEPHAPFPEFPPVDQRLPYALKTPDNFVLPSWTEDKDAPGKRFEDGEKAVAFAAANLSLYDTPFYGPSGARYPALVTESGRPGTTADLTMAVEIRDRYDIDLYFLMGPAMGDLKVSSVNGIPLPDGPVLRGYAAHKEIGRLSLNGVVLPAGKNSVTLEFTGRDPASAGTDLAFVGYGLVPASPRFITEWNLIGPFDAPDMTFLTTAYPPEQEIALDRTYVGKNNAQVRWAKLRGEDAGFMRLEKRITPDEQAVIYGLAYVHAPEEMETHLLIGSDDGVRVWLNGSLVHSNPSYRGAYPDQDAVKVHLRQGWNTLLIKVLQGAGGWGFYVRLADPEARLRWNTEPR